MMSEANKELVRRWVEEIFNAGRSDIAAEVVAADFTENALAPFGQTSPGRVDGPTHVRATVDDLRAQIPDVNMKIETMVADGDLVATRVLASGTNLGRLNGILPPTGRSFSVQQSHWFRVADGRLVGHWAVRDDLRTMLQLGVIPRPAPPVRPSPRRTPVAPGLPPGIRAGRSRPRRRGRCATAGPGCRASLSHVGKTLRDNARRAPREFLPPFR